MHITFQPPPPPLCLRRRKSSSWCQLLLQKGYQKVHGWISDENKEEKENTHEKEDKGDPCKDKESGDENKEASDGLSYGESSGEYDNFSSEMLLFLLQSIL